MPAKFIKDSEERTIKNPLYITGQSATPISGSSADLFMFDESTVDINALLDGLTHIFAKYEIPLGMLDKLLQLRRYRLVFILDDSSSMNMISSVQWQAAMSQQLIDKGTLTNPAELMTRWEELEDRLHVMIDILSYIPTKPITLSFLTSPEIITLSHVGKNPEEFQLDAHAKITTAFAAFPAGRTPLFSNLTTELGFAVSFDQIATHRYSAYGIAPSPQINLRVGIVYLAVVNGFVTYSVTTPNQKKFFNQNTDIPAPPQLTEAIAITRQLKLITLGNESMLTQYTARLKQLNKELVPLKARILDFSFKQGHTPSHPCETDPRMIYLMTDGEPSDATVSAVSDIIEYRVNAKDSPINLMSCTNNPTDVQWMKDVGGLAPFCGETDNYIQERAEVVVKQGAGLPYTLGFWLVRQLVDPICSEDLSALDEDVPLTKHTLSALLGYPLTDADYKLTYWALNPHKQAYQHMIDTFVRFNGAAAGAIANYNSQPRLELSVASVLSSVVSTAWCTFFDSSSNDNGNSNSRNRPLGM